MPRVGIHRNFRGPGQGDILMRFDVYENMNSWAKEMGLGIKQNLALEMERASNIVESHIKDTFEEKKSEHAPKLSERWVRVKERRGIGRIALVYTGELQDSVKSIRAVGSPLGRIAQFEIQWKLPRSKKGKVYWPYLEYSPGRYPFFEEALQRARAEIKANFGRNVMVGLFRLNQRRFSQALQEGTVPPALDFLSPDVFDIVIKYS